MSKGHAVLDPTWLPQPWPRSHPTRTPRNMSVAILLRLLSLSSMRESWSGVCEGRKGSRVMTVEGQVGKRRAGWCLPSYDGRVHIAKKAPGLLGNGDRSCPWEESGPWGLRAGRGPTEDKAVCSRGLGGGSHITIFQMGKQAWRWTPW